MFKYRVVVCHKLIGWMWLYCVEALDLEDEESTWEVVEIKSDYSGWWNYFYFWFKAKKVKKDYLKKITPPEEREERVPRYFRNVVN